jgi:hypothetical protein
MIAWLRRMGNCLKSPTADDISLLREGLLQYQTISHSSEKVCYNIRRYRYLTLQRRFVMIEDYILPLRRFAIISDDIPVLREGLS